MNMDRNDTVLVLVDKIGTESKSGLALQVIVDGETIWLPLSQVEEIHRGEPPSVRIPRWLAEKHDLEEM